MRTLLVCFLVSCAFNAYSKTQDTTCFQKIVTAQNLQISIELSTSCLNANEEFNAGMSFLCSANQIDLSQKYSKYLVYKKQYQAVFEEYRAATNIVERTLANQKMRDITIDWSIAGFRSEVDSNLNNISSAISSCSAK